MLKPGRPDYREVERAIAVLEDLSALTVQFARDDQLERLCELCEAALTASTDELALRRRRP